MLNKRGMVLIGTTVLLIVGTGFWFAPCFSIRSLDWEGNQFIPDSLVRKTLIRYEGCSIFRAWTGGFPRILKEKFPQLDSVHVKAVFPHTIKVTFQERKPWVVFLSGTHQIIVADNGVVMSRKQSDVSAPGDPQLYVSGIPPEFFKGAAVPKGLVASLRKVVVLAEKEVPSGSVQLGFSGVESKPEGFVFRSVTLIVPDGFPVELGGLDGLENRFKTLKSFLDSFVLSPEKPVSYIDLRVSGNILVKYADNR